MADYKTSFELWVALRWALQSQKAHRDEQQAFERDLTVASLGLAGETGEVVEHIKKFIRDGKEPGRDLLLELGDLHHYTVRLAQLHGYTMEEIENANIEKLEARDRKN
jgi:NTP pyrophosphatase (non-canonical NTP hydrolase)